jgi:hypothetical protein
MSVMKDGTEVPDELIIGVTRGKWPVRLFHGPVPKQEAADWLSTGTIHERNDKRVFRVKVEPVGQMIYTPPVEASVSEVAVQPRYRT